MTRSSALRIFLIILTGVVVPSGKLFSTETAPQEPSPAQPFILALPPSATPESDDPNLRITALRMLVYQGKTAEVVTQLRSEKNITVLLETLSSIGAFGGAGDAPTKAFVTEQCRSENEAVAATAVTTLPRLQINDAKIYQAALRHSSPRVRTAAIRAAGDSRIGGQLADEIKKSIDSPDAAIRLAATLAWLKIAAKNHDSPEAPLSEASKLVTNTPALAPTVTSALLALKIQPDKPLSKKLLALPAEHRRGMLQAFAHFPSQFNSDFLREASLNDDAECARLALAMLASKSSPKNNNTLGRISDVLSAKDNALVSAILNAFDSDGEFSMLNRVQSASSDTPETRNDAFTGPGNNPGSLFGALTPDSVQQTRTQRINTAKHNMPSTTKIARFMQVLYDIASDKTQTTSVRNRATLLFLEQSNSPKLLDAAHQLLSNTNTPTIQAGVSLCSKRYDDLRYIGLVLKFITASEKIAPTDFITNPEILVPYLSMNDAVATQVLGHAGRLLLAEENLQKKLLALALLASHGTPANATYALPLCDSPDPLLRRAAYHCISRLAPELFALKTENVLNDPSPEVREIIPLTFFKTGYRWTHFLSNGKNCAQWLTPKIIRVPDEPSLAILNKLAGDTNATVRLNARLALLQHNKLANPESIFDDADGDGGSLFTARLFHAICASGKNPPPEISARIPAFHPNFDSSENNASLTVFINATSRDRVELENRLDALRQTIPDIEIRVYHSNEEVAQKQLNKILGIFPIPPRQLREDNIAISAGAWVSGDKIDFASLVELMAHANNTDGALIEKILNAPSPDESHADEKPANLATHIAIGVTAILALLTTGVILRRRRA